MVRRGRGGDPRRRSVRFQARLVRTGLLSDQVAMVKRVVPPLVLGLALVAQRVPAFQTGQPFRTGVNTVPVYATVTDNRGTPVPDLSAKDFELYDYGGLQPITVFNRDGQAMTIAILLDRSPSVSDASH